MNYYTKQFLIIIILQCIINFCFILQLQSLKERTVFLLRAQTEILELNKKTTEIQSKIIEQLK